MLNHIRERAGSLATVPGNSASSSVTSLEYTKPALDNGDAPPAAIQGPLNPTVADGNGPASPPPSVLRRASTAVSVAAPYVPGPRNEPDPFAGKTIYDFQVLDCYHELYNLQQHKGEIVLICNVASKCKEYSEKGYTLLTKLYDRYRERGFTVLAFPCDQFGGCEPGTEDMIAEMIPCLYASIAEVEFPVMAKMDVNGDHELPLYSFLKSRVKGTIGQSAIKWNFTCFLIDREGNPVFRFAPGATLDVVEPYVIDALRGPDAVKDDRENAGGTIAPTAGSPPAPPQMAGLGTREPSSTELSRTHTNSSNSSNVNREIEVAGLLQKSAEEEDPLSLSSAERVPHTVPPAESVGLKRSVSP